ncbi:hypothetical protein [Castellaniella sp.]|uniref:hypothetical protein n=1 Tax=Castellaniella sp. TaxID=1955812 RepID=UPI002AFE49F1|nr:hypothetical protein [Castellaniella sp.]
MRTVGVNDLGYRVGEDHANARLTDHDVELIRQLHETDGMSYATLATKFSVSKSAVADICRYRRRAQAAVKWVRVSAAQGDKVAP